MKRDLSIHVISRAVIIFEQNILLCKALSKNFYFLPGGHIENEEEAEASLVRELKEETGFDFTISRFLGCLEYIFEPMAKQKVCHTHEYNLIFEAASSQIVSIKSLVQIESHIQLEWISFSKIEEIDLRPYDLKILIPKWLKSGLNEAFKSYTK